MVYVIITIVTIIAIIITVGIIITLKHKAQLALLNNSLDYLKITKDYLEKLFPAYDKEVIVKSRQTLEKYDYPSFFKDNRNYFDIIRNNISTKNKVIASIKDFLKEKSLQILFADFPEKPKNLLLRDWNF